MLAALAGGMGQAGAFQRRQMKGGRGGRQPKARSEVAGSEAVRALCQQQAQDGQPGIDRQGREGGAGLGHFHISS